MNKKVIILLLHCNVLCCLFAYSDPVKSRFVFATQNQGRQILQKQDGFVAQMSSFDRSVRLQTDAPVSEAEYMAFVGENILPWEDDERAGLEKILQNLDPLLAPFESYLPKTVYLVKTTGQEEAHAAYTRANAIMLPPSQLALAPDLLQVLIAHELFHIISRTNPSLRPDLYAVIGFKPCSEIAYPPSLQQRKISNPDATHNNFYIDVTWNGQTVSIVPILFSRTPNYDVEQKGDFFDYLVFKWMVIRPNEKGQYEPLYQLDEPVLLDVNEAGGLYEKIGRNTDYIIHPEEIMADNFSFLICGHADIPSPWVLEKLKKVLIKTTDQAEPNS